MIVAVALSAPAKRLATRLTIAMALGSWLGCGTDAPDPTVGGGTDQSGATGSSASRSGASGGSGESTAAANDASAPDAAASGRTSGAQGTAGSVGVSGGSGGRGQAGTSEFDASSPSSSGSTEDASVTDSDASSARPTGGDGSSGRSDASAEVADGGSGEAGAVTFDGPPMGFNPYNNVWCNGTEAEMRAFADAMVAHGMLAAGYRYLNVDCAWQGSRNSSGVIQSGSTYPSGMKALADYAHGKGLKFGIYTAPGTMTCDNKPGSQGYETEDVQTYASWGVDYIKLDWCGADYSASGAAAIAQKWKSAIAASGRPMVLSINAGGNASVAPWASARVNMWRVGDDICDTWFNKTGPRSAGYAHCTSTTAQSGIYDYLTESLDYLTPYSGTGHWGDSDMLQVGNPGLSLDEAITHFSVWAMWSAPLIAGNDTTKMNGSDIASKVLLNSEVIAIDQDAKNGWATRVKSTGSMQLYKKTLSTPNSVAIALVNMSNAPASLAFSWSDIGLGAVTSMRDLWAHRDITPSGTAYTATGVPAHGTVMLKLTGM